MDTPVDPHGIKRNLQNIYYKTMSRIIIFTLFQNVKHNFHFYLSSSLNKEIKKWTQSVDTQI